MMSAENLLACVSLISWAWQILWVWVWKNFVGIGIGMEKICGYGYGKNFVDMGMEKNFVVAWNFGHWKFLLGMRFSLVILMMGLTLIFADFSGESHGTGWCHHKIFGGKDQKSWASESTAESRFYASQEGNTDGGSSRGGSRRSSHKRTKGPNDAWFVFLTSPAKTKRNVS